MSQTDSERPVVHISDIATYLNCRAKWDFTSPLRQSLAPAKPSKHMWLGRMVHYALAAYYGAGSSTRAAASLRGAYTSEVLRSLGHIKEELGYVPEDLKEFAQLGMDVLNHYALWAPGHDHFTVIMPEVPLKVTRSTYDFAGQTDGLVQDLRGDLWLLEHKTSSRIPAEPLVAMAYQGQAYVWAARKDPALANVGFIKGIMYNFLYKVPPTKPEVLASGQLAKRRNLRSTPEAYLALVRAKGLDPDDYAEFVSLLPKDLFFRRYLITYSDEQLQIFEHSLEAIVGEIINKPAIYPQDALRTCPGCEFTELCRARFSGQLYNDMLEEFSVSEYYKEDA